VGCWEEKHSVLEYRGEGHFGSNRIMGDYYKCASLQIRKESRVVLPQLKLGVNMLNFGEILL